MSYKRCTTLNVLTAINKKYLPYFAVMVRSFAENNDGEHTVYVATKEVTKEDFDGLRPFIPQRVTVVPVAFCEDILKNAPTVKRWPKEIYYRLFAAQYLPTDVDKVLYLDSDIVVKGDLSALYNTDFQKDVFVATTNIHNPLFKWLILVKNGAKRGSVYANTGVLLMNLKRLREEQDVERVLKYIRRRKWLLSLPDQDVLSALYGKRVRLVDNKVYNLSEREIKWHKKHKKQNLDEEWVEINTKIIHYLSRNKPWKEGYKGILKPWYDRYEALLKDNRI